MEVDATSATSADDGAAPPVAARPRRPPRRRGRDRKIANPQNRPPGWKPKTRRGGRGCPDAAGPPSARDRLLSIRADAAFVREVTRRHSSGDGGHRREGGDIDRGEANYSWPVLCNERCGSWCGHPLALLIGGEGRFRSERDAEGVASSEAATGRCYFKSTDGHCGTWSFSLRRLNLPALSFVFSSGCGGCLLVDASRTKSVPDSLARTVPIWCAVWNRARARAKAGTGDSGDAEWWDVDLYAPPSIVSPEEKLEIEARLDGHVDALMSSGAVDPAWIVKTVTKPLRPYWIMASSSSPSSGGTDDSGGEYSDKCLAPGEYDTENYACVVCVSCSKIETAHAEEEEESRADSSAGNGSDDEGALGAEHGAWQVLESEASEPGDLERLNFRYIPGAADDHESWSRGLTPSLFWSNHRAILDDCRTAEDTNGAIDGIVAKAKAGDEEWYVAGAEAGTSRNDGANAPSVATVDPEESKAIPPLSVPPPEKIHHSVLGLSGLSIGTRRSGRPPLCWSRHDCVINVTELEYPTLSSDGEGSEGVPPGKYYLHLPVREGKRDRTGLETYLGEACAFAGAHLAQGRTIVVHCAQGMDRSVGVAIAVVALFCELNDPDLPRPEWCEGVSMQGIERGVLGTGGAGVDVSNGEGGAKSHDANDGEDNRGSGEEEEDQEHGRTGMSTRLVEALRGHDGRARLFDFIRRLREGAASEDGNDDDADCGDSPSTAEMAGPLAIKGRVKAPAPSLPATKDSLRLALHRIQHYHERASPTRATMQKLNRFFLSGEFERGGGNNGNGGGESSSLEYRAR